MSQPEHFEMLVLGSGEGGKFLAWHMAKSGHRTAVVERNLIGVLARTPTACLARMRFGVRKLPISFTAPIALGS